MLLHTSSTVSLTVVWSSLENVPKVIPSHEHGSCPPPGTDCLAHEGLCLPVLYIHRVSFYVYVQCLLSYNRYPLKPFIDQ